ncbi:MAG: hypothetical protein SFV18_17035 [Bryobacteraceae bacterium]|nr:hypothetical protein [Bryobacteraceae bacterium]
MDHVETAEIAAAPAETVPAPKPDPAKVEVSALDVGATEETVAALIREACEAGIRAVVVRPCDLDLAARSISDKTILAAAISYPGGTATTSVKVYEARDALRRGAREIHAAVNVGKLNSRQFQYVEMELIQLAQTCHEAGAKLRAVLRTPLLNEEAKLVVAKIAKRSEVDSVIAEYAEAPPEDESLLLRKCPPLVEVIAHRSTAADCLRALSDEGFSGVHAPIGVLR